MVKEAIVWHTGALKRKGISSKLFKPVFSTDSGRFWSNFSILLGTCGAFFSMICGDMFRGFSRRFQMVVHAVLGAFCKVSEKNYSLN